MPAKVSKLNYGAEFANTYILGEEGEPCLVIDFGYNRNHCVENYVKRHHSSCAGILLTHGHYDHIAGLNDLQQEVMAPIFMPNEDLRCLRSGKYNCSDYLSAEEIIIAERIQPYGVDDGDEIALGGYEVQVIATPFHTEGSVCYYLPTLGILFSGDTLFHLGIGRYDLPGAAPRLMRESLAKLARLPGETKVYPGHGPSTTIGDEKRFNDAFQDL